MNKEDVVCTHTHIHYIYRHTGEDGNPFQYSCLENPMEPGELESYIIHGVSKSWIQLSNQTTQIHTGILLSHKRMKSCHL